MPTITRARVVGAALALGLAGPLLAGGTLAAQKADSGDVALLNTAIAAERAALKAYADATATTLLSPPVLAVLQGFVADHTAHLAALVEAVTAAGGTPTQDAAALQTPSLASEGDILAYAYAVERLAATTHLGSLATFKNRDLAKTAGSILGVETTHVALLAEALRTNPAYPTSFVTP